MKTLALFFTYGASLENWDKTGSLNREINIYRKLSKYFDKIFFVTYGKNDFRYAQQLPSNIIILPKKINVNNFLYSFLLLFLYRKEFAESTWIKTNQMIGSWSAVLAKLLFKKKYKQQNIHVIPNGIDTQIFKPMSEKFFSEKIRLFFVGRLHPEKNIENLLEAINNLKNITIKIIGQGPLEKNILKFKKKYDLDLELISSIPNNELPRIYAMADIYIQPSLYEGNPKTILEAMSCGLPVIATSVDGIKNIIKHKENGYLCETGIKSIESAIMEVIANKNLKENMAINARKFVEENYNLDIIIRKESEIYRNNE